MRGRTSLDSLAAVLLALTLGVAPGAVRAASFFDLTVDSAQSWLELLPGSALVVTAGAPIGTVSAALVSPAGDGSNSGLRAAVSGTVRGRYDTALVFPTFDLVESVTRIGLVESGAFAPGLPGSTAVPAPAGWAITFGANALGIAGEVALREFALTLSGGGRVSSVGPDAFVFPNPFPPPPLPPPAISFAIAGGFFDLATSFVASDRFSLGESRFAAPIDPANRPGVQLFGPDLARLTLPVRASVVITAADLGSPLPFELRFEVGGQIVAQNFPVPEPGTAALLVGGLLWFAQRCARAERRNHA